MDCPSTLSPTNVRVVRFRTFDQLGSLASEWDRLARGVPFRSWAWLSHWWRHYGDEQEGPNRKTGLFTLGVFDRAGAVVGIAPWYVDSSVAHGRVVRFLGSGEVCSDYLSVLCEPGREDTVARALAHWLTKADTLPEAHTSTKAHSLTRVPAAQAEPPTDADPDRWDLLELTGVDAEDTIVGRLAEALEACGNTVHRRAGPNCWRIELPARWDEYLAKLSKPHRRQVRRSVRYFLATGRVKVHSVRRLDDLPQARRVLVDLHQRRRRSLGEPGSFDSSRFSAFHRDVMPDLLRQGQLLLDWLELDGRPIAAEYRLAGSGVVYAYQSGVDPDALEHSPGRLSHITVLRRAIEQGYRAFDFLRGDEPYKSRWRAEPRPSVQVRVVPARAAAQLRHGIWLAGRSIKEWVKSGLRLVGH